MTTFSIRSNSGQHQSGPRVAEAAHVSRAGLQASGRGLRLRSKFIPAATCFGVTALAAALSGCSSSTSAKPLVVSIVATDANGNPLTTQAASLGVNTGAYFDVILTNDTSGLGADWTAACGSAPAPGTPLPPGTIEDDSCGTFTPVHTQSGPVPSYATSGSGYVTLYTPPAAPPKGGVVTLYAAATADPSRYASLTLTIVGQPISIGFAPLPPASLAVGAAASLNAVVSNDYSAGGVNWTVACGSSACGTISPAKTASGVATTFTAPAAVPAGGSVTITATSVTDPTKAITATITIAPIAVSLAPSALTVATGATGLLNATVTNDARSAGVDWTLTCGSTGACGTITAHTASGAAAVYTAPAAVPSGGTVTITATSTADGTTCGTAIATITATAAPAVAGVVRAGRVAVSGAKVSFYAAGTAGYASAAQLLNRVASVTDADGSFSIAGANACPASDSLLYLVAEQGYAGGVSVPRLALIAALGPCNSYASTSRIVIDEATTVAAVYSLSAFMKDAAHVGSSLQNHRGLTDAFVNANDLVDVTSGDARSVTRNGYGKVPIEEIDTLANLLDGCLLSVPETSRDREDCASLFPETSGSAPADSIGAMLSLARGAAAAATPAGLHLTDQLLRDSGNGPFQPSLKQQPETWAIHLSYGSCGQAPLAEPASDISAWSNQVVDGAGRRWSVSAEGIALLLVTDTLMSSVASPLAAALDAAALDLFVVNLDSAGDISIRNRNTGAIYKYIGIATPVIDFPVPAAVSGRTVGTASSQPCIYP